MKPAPKKKQGKEKPLTESGTRFRTYNKEVIKSNKTINKYDVGYFLTGMYRNGQSSVDLSA